MEPPVGRARQAPWWLPALFAVGLLLALTTSAFLVVQRGPAPHAARSATLSPEPVGPAVALPTVSTVSAASASPVPPAPPARLPAKTAAKKAMNALTKAAPLSVLLTSSIRGHHVRVGEDVTLTALARGPCVSLALSYRHGLGRKTTHSFTEGGLLSTTWTPSGPGRYGFTATAHGGPRQTAASRPIEITVDDPAPQRVARGASALPAEVITPLPPLAVRLPPLPQAAPRPQRPRPAWAKPPVTAPPGDVTPENVTPENVTPAPRPAPAVIYHVAAAQFPLSRSAVVLAKSFRLRGSPATTKRMVGYHGKTVYAVVTGAYRSPEEARAAALLLQRSGYPAYFFGG